MDDLVAKAEVFLSERYKRPVHTVAAALQAGSGKVYLGTNIDHFSGYVCAETSVLATAMNAGETVFTRMACVRREPDGAVAIANACGKCRQILHDYAPGIKLAINNNGMTEEVEIEALLPYAFKRQQEKIQAALKSEGDQNST